MEATELQAEVLQAVVEAKQRAERRSEELAAELSTLKAFLTPDEWGGFRHPFKGDPTYELFCVGRSSAFCDIGSLFPGFQGVPTDLEFMAQARAVLASCGISIPDEPTQGT